jgi:hypothetical protein
LNSNGVLQKHGNYNGTDPINPYNYIQFDISNPECPWYTTSGNSFLENKLPKIEI